MVHRAELRLSGAAPFQDEDAGDAAGRHRHAAVAGAPTDPTDAGGRPVLAPIKSALPFPGGARAEIRIPAPKSQISLGLGLRAPARPTEELAVDLVLREAGDRKQVLGGLAVRVQAV